jgi:hypothetical protein
METNVLALRCICSLLPTSQPSSCLSELESLARSNGFDYRRSQLRFFEKGVESDAGLRELFAPIFNVLKAGE